MEIRNVVNEVKNEYPKMQTANKISFENKIPKIVLFFGLSMVKLKNKVFAIDIDVGLAGGFPTIMDMHIRCCKMIQILSIMMFIMTVLIC